jgi:hypothetical protein
MDLSGWWMILKTPLLRAGKQEGRINRCNFSVMG